MTRFNDLKVAWKNLNLYSKIKGLTDFTLVRPACRMALLIRYAGLT